MKWNACEASVAIKRFRVSNQIKMISSIQLQMWIPAQAQHTHTHTIFFQNFLQPKYRWCCAHKIWLMAIICWLSQCSSSARPQYIFNGPSYITFVPPLKAIAYNCFLLVFFLALFNCQLDSGHASNQHHDHDSRQVVVKSRYSVVYAWYRLFLCTPYLYICMQSIPVYLDSLCAVCIPISRPIKLFPSSES